VVYFEPENDHFPPGGTPPDPLPEFLLFHPDPLKNPFICKLKRVSKVHELIHGIMSFNILSEITYAI
jgi:hypothetical protein